MIRIKKIRGHKRIWKQIDQWKLGVVNLDLEELKSSQRLYTKVYVHPYSSISLLGSVPPIPTGKTRTKIILSLFEIYESWKKQIEQLAEPYYLKIWFFPDNVGKSQVVCAIRERIDWYETIFYQQKNRSKRLDETIFGDACTLARNLNWRFAVEELSIDDDYLGEIEDWSSLDDYYDTRRWLKRKMKMPHRIIQHNNHTYFNFPQHNVWLGGT